jgi:hypothetical protein
VWLATAAVPTAVEPYHFAALGYEEIDPAEMTTDHLETPGEAVYQDDRWAFADHFIVNRHAF